MSAEEYLKAHARSSDYNIRESSFSSSYYYAGNEVDFDIIKTKATAHNAFVILPLDSDGMYTYIPRVDKNSAFKVSSLLTTYKIGVSNANIYVGSDGTIYDALGNSLSTGITAATTSLKEYSIIIAGNTDLYEAIFGSRGGSELHVINLAYINSNGSTAAILYKCDGYSNQKGVSVASDTEYLIPKKSLLNYLDKLANMLLDYGTSFRKNEDGTYLSNGYVYYYDESVTFTHVSKKQQEVDIDIDYSNVKGTVVFETKQFEGNASILYSYEKVSIITNDYDFYRDGERYKIHSYTNKKKESIYEEDAKLPRFYYLNIAFSSDNSKCAVLCHQINKDKTVATDYSTITFSKTYKYSKFTSELGIFSGEETYLQFGDEYYSFLNKSYDLYMYRSNDFGVLKAKDEELDHNYLAINEKRQTVKIFSTNISSLSTANHLCYYSTGEKANLQFNILNTANFSNQSIVESDTLRIANLEYCLYWSLENGDRILKDFMGQTIITDNVSNYLYEQDIGSENRTATIHGHSYTFYTFYGASKYSKTTEGLSYNSLYYLTNRWA
ncbi:MAG: hypothetical protein K6F07_00035 [Bacilli bacterium]|nr:hypothetical protein [Bacilli bacterium]